MRTFKKFIVFVVLFICFLSFSFEGRIVKAFDYTDLGFDSLEELCEALGVSYLLEEKEEPNENISYVINNCEPFIEKYHIEDLNFPISVGFKFRNIPGTFVEINSEEERIQHNQYLNELYKTENEEHFNKINLTSYYKTYTSQGGPFIIYYYESYSNFLETDYQIVENFRDESLACIYIDFSYASNTSSTTTKDDASDYDFDDAKEDVIALENSDYIENEEEKTLYELETLDSISSLQNTDYTIAIEETKDTDCFLTISKSVENDNEDELSFNFDSSEELLSFKNNDYYVSKNDKKTFNPSFGFINNKIHKNDEKIYFYLEKKNEKDI